MNSRSDFKCGFSTLLFSSLLSGKKYEIITLVLKPQNGIEFFCDYVLSSKVSGK